MSQSKADSVIETCTNIAVGFIVAVISQMVIFHAYDLHVSLATNIEMTIWFTFVSFVRSYTLRRFFNNKKIISDEKETTNN